MNKRLALALLSAYIELAWDMKVRHYLILFASRILIVAPFFLILPPTFILNKSAKVKNY